MKKELFCSMAAIFLIALTPFILISCGSNSSSGGGSGTPEISLISFSPSSATLSRGQAYIVTVNWSDSDGDILTIYVQETWNSGSETLTANATQYGLVGYSGTIRYNGTTNMTAALGVHSFNFWVIDAKGNRSNTISFATTII
jgi:hypothetical protein